MRLRVRRRLLHARNDCSFLRFVHLMHYDWRPSYNVMPDGTPIVFIRKIGRVWPATLVMAEVES